MFPEHSTKYQSMLYNAQIGREIEDWETCNQLVDKIVERVDQPFKDKDVAAAFSCQFIASTQI